MCGDGKNIPGAGFAAVAVGHPADGAAEAAAITGGNTTIGHGRAAGHHLEALKGGRVGQHSIRINDPMADMLPMGIGRTRS